MTLLFRLGCVLAAIVATATASVPNLRRVQQRTSAGIIEGVVSADGNVRVFKGIPFAAPPVGPLRWREPQPVAPWTGVRQATEFGPRPMQAREYSDMVFRDAGPSEDCLYLNVWVPARPQTSGKLPVMVWIFGGGFKAGSASEPRQDGSALCQLGVIVVSLNYRLGVFGFLAHPELSAESAHHASGNYGLMDQVAALKWVHENIAGFGGDPENVTIFGESAGSTSVCCLIATPLARGLFQKAIGESGAAFPVGHGMPTLADAQAEGTNFIQTRFGGATLEDLRQVPAEKLLAESVRMPRPEFKPVVDGYVLPQDCAELYQRGRQAHVPLLAGSNRDEGRSTTLLGSRAPTVENFAAAARERYGVHASEFLRVYTAADDAAVERAAADFGGDLFTGFATWRWLELHGETSGQPVYRYEFDQPLPLAADAPAGAPRRAPHAADIEFVFRTLPSRHLPWQPEDLAVSDLMARFWTNFARTGSPSGPGLPAWPPYDRASDWAVMHVQTKARSAPDAHRARDLFLQQYGAGETAAR